MGIVGKTNEITIFLNQGSTLMFYDCELLESSMHGSKDICDIVFTYFSRETGKKKQAMFCTNRIAGFSFEVYAEPKG